MTTYAPKLHRSIVAVRLKSDLMAARGDWVGIDPETDAVVHMTHEEFTSVYGKQDVSSAAQQVATKKPGGQNARRHIIPNPTSPPVVTKWGNRTPDSMLSTQAGRFFYLLRRYANPVKQSELFPHLDPIDKPKSVSSALSALKELGLVQSQPSGDPDSAHLWSVTDRGCVAFDRIGPVSFTKKGLQVPPDRLPPSEADRLAAAWRDRHAP